MKPLFRRLLGGVAIAAALYSCASVGRIEGGPYDETPPRFISGTPTPGALHHNKNKLSIEFDEFIKLDKPNEKIVISPPQVQQPEIKSNGKKVVITLQDTLKPNTTYTFDFGDAIQDNNEGNPLENFFYSFSTGDRLDSMAVAGTVLNAANLEPVKGMLVGLHANLADSAFTKLPFERVGRTDSRGRFSIRGVAPGKYRIYALQDADQNFAYSQPTEVIAFNDSIIIPSMEERMRQDTTWIDSLTVDTIVERQYTHYLPDDVLLRAFKELSFSQRFLKAERLTPEKFSLYFTAPADTLPLLKGLNFNEEDAFVIEQPTGRNDTIHYWIKDSLLYKQDSLKMSITYLYTDSLKRLVPRTDTLNVLAKLTYDKQQKQKQEAKEKEQKEADKLAEYKSTLTNDELEELVSKTKELKEYQDTPSSQKDLEKIPQLELKDITREPAKLYIDPKKIGGVDVIHHNMFTNGIAYIMMCYDCKNVPDELLPYIGLLSSVLGLMDTEKYTYTELTNEININCGGISTDAAIYTDNKDFDKCTIMYEVKGKVLYDNIQFVLDMMNEIIYKTKFSDYKRLKEIIAKLKSRMESTMTSAGHSTAMLAGMAQFSRNAYYSNEMRGYGFYELIQKLDSQFDELKEDISDKLSKLVDYIFHKENIIVSFTADDKGYDAFAPAFGKYAEELKKSDMPACERKYTPANVKTGYTSASQVQYVARCGNFRDGGYEYTGALRVLKVIFSYDYLWINVRVKGGAYGCMSGSYRNGDMYMVSYRDPNLRKTNDIYENAADYLEHFDVSDRDMVKFIIGTIGDIDTPMNPAAKGTRSFGAYICNTDYESLKKERGQVLDCNVERIRELAPLVRCAMDENYFCVVGSSKEINKESELFDKIQPLIKVQG